MNLGFGGGVGFGFTIGGPGLLALAAAGIVGAVALAELTEPRRSANCCGTGNVPQIIPQDLCLKTHPAGCCPVIT